MGKARREISCVVASRAPPTGGTNWLTTQVWALTGNQTGDSLVHRLVLNPPAKAPLPFKKKLLILERKRQEERKASI